VAPPAQFRVVAEGFSQPKITMAPSRKRGLAGVSVGCVDAAALQRRGEGRAMVSSFAVPARATW